MSTAKDSDPLARAAALIAAGEPGRAARLLQSQLDTGRGGLLTRLALGRAHLSAGDIATALEVLHAASELAPGIADAALALGEALMAAGHLPAAVAEFERAARLSPDLAAPRYALGSAWLEAGEPDRAIEILSGLVGSDSELSDAASRKITAARAMKTADRAPQSYVRHLFDQFSSDYDARMLGELHYRVPSILAELAQLVLGQARDLDILDLGCGTGLAGERFKERARRLDGVDLSPRMLEKARARRIYDTLTLADLERVLMADGPSYDLILAADTLVYLGDLAPTFRGARRRLKHDGFFLFTVESKPGDGYDLGSKRRYRHSEEHLRATAGTFRFDVMGMMHCTLRIEAKSPVNGLAAALQAIDQPPMSG